MANKVKGFRVGMKVRGVLNSANGEKVEGKITKVNCKGKAVVDVEGRGKCIIPLHSLTPLTGKATTKKAAAAKAPAKKKTASKSKAKAKGSSKKKK